MILRTLYEAAVIILIAVGLALAAYALHPEGLPLLADKSSYQPAEQSQLLFHSMPLQQAEALFEKQKALFADARPLDAYAKGHVKGAIHLDPEAFDQWGASLIDRIPPDQTIITYCDGANCPLARRLAEKLTWLGYEKVYYIEDGWNYWRSRNLPTSTE